MASLILNHPDWASSVNWETNKEDQTLRDGQLGEVA